MELFMTYITLSGFKTYKDFDTDSEDGLLQDLIDSAYTIVNDYTGRVFDVSTVTGRTFSRYTNYPSRFANQTLYLDEDLVGEATYITDSPTVLYLPENDDPNYAIFLTEGAWNSTAVTVSGYWGYSKTAPTAIQQASLRLTQWLYDMRSTNRGDAVIITPEGQVLLPQGLPQDVVTILAPYRKVRVY